VGELAAINPTFGIIYWINSDPESSGFIDSTTKQRFKVTGTIEKPEVFKL
jgi:hypothetical protein